MPQDSVRATRRYLEDDAEVVDAPHFGVAVQHVVRVKDEPCARVAAVFGSGIAAEFREDRVRGATGADFKNGPTIVYAARLCHTIEIDTAGRCDERPDRLRTFIGPRSSGEVNQRGRKAEKRC